MTTAIELLLKGVVDLTRADVGRIYQLELKESSFIPQFEFARTADAFVPSEQPPVNVSILCHTEPHTLVEQAIHSRSVVTTEAHGLTQALGHGSYLLPVVRGTACLGVLQLDSGSPQFAKNITKYDIELAGALLLSLFERQASLELLKAVQQPIDFLKPFEDFLDAILTLVHDASRMPYLALRELEGDGRRLRCLTHYGFGDLEKSSLDLYPVEDTDPFRLAVVEGRTIVERTMAAPHLSALQNRQELNMIKSFVVAPVKVGTTTFGTLSFGAACPFDYSPLQVAGFESIANLIGTAITNSRNAHRLREISIADAKLGIAIVGLEVAQSARHEIRGSVDNCQVNLALLEKFLKSPKDSSDQIHKTVNAVGDELFRINLAMDKIKNAAREPDDLVRSSSLKEVWDQAIGMVTARLTQERIRVKITGRDACIDVMPDSLRHAYLHLLLNSIDAFKERRMKGDRVITVFIDPQSDDAIDVKMRYADNATGIDPSGFGTLLNGEPPKEIGEVIFDKGVTTKASGSGYGLYLTRLILTKHHGSIELISYRGGGVVFDLILPKNLQVRRERRRQG